MCTLMVLYRRHREFPLVVAANRDERLDRPSAPPGILRENPLAIGGRDLVAGGTWLGWNALGLFIAVTNRRAEAPEQPARSRGILALDALACASAPEAARQALAGADQHNPFNLVLLDPVGGVVLMRNEGGTRSQRMEPGALVVTNGEPNDAAIPNVARGLGLLEALGDATEAELVERLGAACADHRQENSDYPPFCVHRPPFGTVSSTILLVRGDGTGRYLFAPGPPCVTPHDDYGHLLRG